MRIIGDNVRFKAFNDNNDSCDFNPDQFTYWGIVCTLFNILKGINKSYYDSFKSCRRLEDTENFVWHEILNREEVFERLNLPKNFIDDSRDKLYMTLSKNYTSIPTLLIMTDSCPRAFYPTKSKHDVKFSILSSEVPKKILEDYANQSNSEIFYGVKLKKGTITLDDVKKDEDFISMVDNWMIFNRNDKYIVVVNSNPVNYNLPTLTLKQEIFDFGDDEPLFFYIKKDGMKPVGWSNDLIITDYHKKVLNYLNKNNGEQKNIEKKVRGFLDFFKNKN